MSEAIAFDTHRFVKHLTENGFTEQQAEVLADEQVQLLNTNLATQADVAAIQRDIAGVQREIEVLRQETKATIEGLRQETQANLATVRQEIEVLRQETKASLAGVQSDLLKWMVGALIAQGGVIVTLLKLLPG